MTLQIGLATLADHLQRSKKVIGARKPSTIDTHIKNLRAKIESDSRSPRYIETVYGVGYRFTRE